MTVWAQGAVVTRIDSSTAYMYRGSQVEDAFVLQPSVTGLIGPLAFGVWSNYNCDVNDYDEIDTFVSLSQKVGKLNATVGGQAYFIFDVFNTYDVSLALSHDSLKYFNLLGVYDFGQWDGFYGEANVSPSFPLNEKFTISSVMGMGYNQDYMCYSHGFSHLYGSMSLSFQWTQHAKFILTGYHQEKIGSDFLSKTMGQLSFVREI
jgi:hypothetical protein